jgi:hypothetical protein
MARLSANIRWTQEQNPAAASASSSGQQTGPEQKICGPSSKADLGTTASGHPSSDPRRYSLAQASPRMALPPSDAPPPGR